MSSIAANIQPLTRDNFVFVRDLLKRETAIVLADGKEYLVETRLASIATRRGFGSVNDLVDDLKRGVTTSRLDILESLTTNETLFFRDLAPFDALREHIIPECHARNPTSPIQIWSAACSTGQEPYSIAMLFAENHAAVSYRIIGTDISNKVLEKAKSGAYLQHEINRGLPAKMLIKHFRQEGGLWKVSDSIRSRVDYRYLNLIDKWRGLPMCDIVMMRNVLIYFDVETRREILRQVKTVLRPGGYLCLGGAESAVQLDSTFQPITLGRSTFYRVG